MKKNRKIYEELKYTYFSHPANYNAIDKRYFKMSLLTYLVVNLEKAIIWSFNIMMITIFLLACINKKIDLTLFATYYESIYLLLLSFRLSISLFKFIFLNSSSGINDESINVPKVDLVNVGNILKVTFYLFSLVLMLLYINETQATKIVIAGLIILVLLVTIPILYFITFKICPKEFQLGNNLIEKFIKLEKSRSESSSLVLNYTNVIQKEEVIRSLKKMKYFKDPNLFRLVTSKEDEEKFRHDYNVSSYYLLNDNIEEYILTNISKNLSVKLIDLKNSKVENFNSYDLEDKSKTLIFINGELLTETRFTNLITGSGQKRSYLYINGTVAVEECNEH